MKKGFIAVLIILGLLSQLHVSVYGATDEPSGWALDSVNKLKDSELFNEENFRNYKDNITRKQFIELAVRTYEISNGVDVGINPSITFNDTTDIYALKGAAIGITEGTGNGAFSPDIELSREQLAVLMMNTVKLIGAEINPVNTYKFTDEAEFSNWAKESIYLAKTNGIISGVGHDRFNSKGGATIEAALKISYAILADNENFLSAFDSKNIETVLLTPTVEDKLMHVSYQVTVDDYSTGKAKVKMFISNINRNNVTIKNHGYHGFHADISDVTVENIEGKELSFIKNKLNNENFGTIGYEWTIQTSNTDQIVIEYEVFKQVLSDGQYRGYIGNDFGLVTGEQLISLYIDDDSLWNADLRIKFNVPKGSTIVTPWEVEDGIYYPNRGFYDSQYKWLDQEDNLMQSTIALGDFIKVEKKVGDTLVNVALPGSWELDRQIDVADNVFNLIDYYNGIFGESIGKYYMLAYSGNTHDHESIWAGEWSLSQGASVIDNDYRLTMIAHQIFHRWNGWTWGWDTNQSEMSALLIEGNNRYYEGKSIAKLTQEMNYTSNNDMSYLASLYDDYNIRYAENRTMAYVASSPVSEDEDSSWTAYAHGALIWLALDMQIYEDTKGEKSVDDIMSYVNLNYGTQAKTISLSMLINDIKSITGVDYTNFVNDYIKGTKYLELDKYFADTDGDGVPYYYEVYLDMDPNRYDYVEGNLKSLQNVTLTRNTVVIGDRDNCESFSRVFGFGQQLTGNPSTQMLQDATCVVLLNNGYIDLNESKYKVFNEMNTYSEEEQISKVVDGKLYIYIKTSSNGMLNKINNTSKESLFILSE